MSPGDPPTTSTEPARYFVLSRPLRGTSSKSSAPTSECSCAAGSSPIAATRTFPVPVHWALDDWEQYAFVPELFGSELIEDPEKAFSMWHADLAAITEEGGCFTLTSHPFLTGRPARVRVLDRSIDRHAADAWTVGRDGGRGGRARARPGSAAPGFPQPSLPD